MKFLFRKNKISLIFLKIWMFFNNHFKWIQTHAIFQNHEDSVFVGPSQRYTYRVLQTIQMKLILLCVWAERAVLGSAKTTLKFKYEIQIVQHIYSSMFGAEYKLENWKE